MKAKKADRPRVRAWMVIRKDLDRTQAEDVLGVDTGTEEYVIVRADRVVSRANEVPALVVPIDALYGDDKPTDIYLDMAITAIEEKLGIGPSEYEILKVEWNQTSPPHSASGYITSEESHRAIDNRENGGKPGRQDNSPGFNPWG